MWIDDEILGQCHQDLVVKAWTTNQTLVVLGASNDPSLEVDVESCAQDNIQILRRYGGGGTVVLYDGCAILSIGCWVRQHFNNSFYFDLVNRSVIASLAENWPSLHGLSQRGLSDIVFGDLKVAGTSLFRSRNYLLYQASILVDCEPARIARYLKHPSREPDYRKGRDHDSFLTGLSSIEPLATVSGCVEHLSKTTAAKMMEFMEGELAVSMPEQWSALRRRAGL